jgi:hypothetical protein
MQTFLPYKDFTKSAQALDNKRLNKQILECYQILKVSSNDDPKAAWRNHPAVKMWRGVEGQLWLYTMAMVEEADIRGIKTDKNVSNLNELKDWAGDLWGYEKPKWYTNPFAMDRLTTTHKANLYTKDSIYYFEFHNALATSNPCCPERKEPCKYYWVAHDPKFKESNETIKSFQMAS